MVQGNYCFVLLKILELPMWYLSHFNVGLVKQQRSLILETKIAHHTAESGFILFGVTCRFAFESWPHVFNRMHGG